MRKPASVSPSILIGSLLLFILLTVFSLIITNQIISDALDSNESPSTFVLVLGAMLVLLLLVFLILNLLRLVSELRHKKPGAGLRLRLSMLFAAMAVVTAFPLLVMTGTVLRSALDAWFTKDTNQSLEFGLQSTIAYYQERSNGLEAAAQNERLDRSIEDAIRQGIDASSSIDMRLHERFYLDAVQIFDSEKQLLLWGESDLALSFLAAQQFGLSRVERESIGGTSYLRYAKELRIGEESVRVLLTRSLFANFDKGAALLSDTQQRLRDYSNQAGNYPVLIFLIFLLLTVPILLIALVAGILFSDTIVQPLLQLEDAVQKVSLGDYTVRLLQRGDSSLGVFVASFNEMVRELERSRNLLMQSERHSTWQDIAQKMAHEIKNPLTPIRLSAERLVRKLDNPPEQYREVVQDSVKTILDEVQAITRLLSEFSNYARLPLPHPEKLSLRSLVEEVWASLGSSHTLELSELQSETQLLVDRLQWTQLFRNLFLNAIDAMEGKNGTVAIAAFPIHILSREYIRIQVSDTGKGLSEAQLTQIFRPYVTYKAHGTGMGLAIVEKIVLDHGGKIRVESEEGVGTSFFIDVPARLSGEDA